jgi:hypothetical protein
MPLSGASVSTGRVRRNGSEVSETTGPVAHPNSSSSTGIAASTRSKSKSGGLKLEALDEEALALAPLDL